MGTEHVLSRVKTMQEGYEELLALKDKKIIMLTQELNDWKRRYTTLQKAILA